MEAVDNIESTFSSSSSSRLDDDADVRAEAALIRASINILDDKLDVLDEAIDACMMRADSLRPWVLCGTADAASFRSIHRFEFAEARRWQQWARPHHRRTSGPFSVIYGYCLDGLAAREQLDLEAAEVSLRHAMQLATSRGEDSDYSSLLTGALLGELLYEQGKLDEAERLLDQSYRLGAEGGTVDFMLATFATGARLKFWMGRRNDAVERLDQGERLAKALRLPRLAAHITNERIRTGIGIADMSPAKFPPGLPSRLPDGITQVTAEITEESAIRLLLGSKSRHASVQAYERAHALATSIDPQLRPRASLNARLLLAECLAATDSPGEAEHTFLPLLEQCARANLVQPILDVGPHVRALVRRLDEARNTHDLNPRTAHHLDQIMTLQGTAQP